MRSTFISVSTMINIIVHYFVNGSHKVALLLVFVKPKLKRDIMYLDNLASNCGVCLCHHIGIYILLCSCPCS